MAMLVLDNVHLSYGAIAAVQGVSLTVAEGEIVSIVGSNGAGKSTLLNGIAGLVPLRSGKITFNGTPLETIPPHQRISHGIALSPEGRGVFPDQSVKDNLALGAYHRRLTPEAFEAELALQYARFPRLKERQDQMAATLSGGEQQMLAIARALMGRPRLLMLDEPSLGLAPLIIQEIFRTLKTLREEGVTIILVEQMASLALAAADRGYVLENGRITLSGTGKDLLHDPKVRAAYLGSAKQERG